MKKMITEKKTGEKYASKSAMMKHEKSEGKKERMMEYGSPKKPSKSKVSTSKPKAPAKKKSGMKLVIKPF